MCNFALVEFVIPSEMAWAGVSIISGIMLPPKVRRAALTGSTFSGVRVLDITPNRRPRSPGKVERDALALLKRGADGRSKYCDDVVLLFCIHVG